MEKENAIKIFENKRVRVLWDDELEKWYFSIVDVIGVLSDSGNPQVYWRVLKKRLLNEGNETVTNCNTLTTRNTLRFIAVLSTKPSFDCSQC